MKKRTLWIVVAVGAVAAYFLWWKKRGMMNG